MESHSERQGLSAVLETDPKRELTQRILGSALFHRSARLRSFLLYVVEYALAHPGEALTEHQIGCAVFERAKDYSPGEDNIVRVHARQLRTRLEEYFAGPGKGESSVLEIPKGSYLPVFHERVDLRTVAAVEPETLLIPAARPWVSMGIIAALCILSGYLLLRETGVAKGSAPSWILQALFAKTMTTRMVVPDSSFGLLQGFLGRNLTLEDYLKPGYPDSLGWPKDKGKEYVERAMAVVSRPYTTYSEVLIATRMAVEAQRRGWDVVFSYPRNLSPRDFEAGNFILLGSPKSNPWTSLYEGDSNFRSIFRHDSGRGGILNRAPRGAELGEYFRETPNGYAGEVYALITLRASKAGTVLTLAGTNMEATEAAWDFVASVERADDLLKRLGAAKPVAGRSFALEVVLKSYAMAGSARDTSVVATRWRAE